MIVLSFSFPPPPPSPWSQGALLVEKGREKMRPPFLLSPFLLFPSSFRSGRNRVAWRCLIVTPLSLFFFPPFSSSRLSPQISRKLNMVWARSLFPLPSSSFFSPPLPFLSHCESEKGIGVSGRGRPASSSPPPPPFSLLPFLSSIAGGFHSISASFLREGRREI